MLILAAGGVVIVVVAALVVAGAYVSSLTVMMMTMRYKLTAKVKRGCEQVGEYDDDDMSTMKAGLAIMTTMITVMMMMMMMMMMIMMMRRSWRSVMLMTMITRWEGHGDKDADIGNDDDRSFSHMPAPFEVRSTSTYVGPWCSYLPLRVSVVTKVQSDPTERLSGSIPAGLPTR